MDKNKVEPTLDSFESYEAAAEFWDTHDTTDYLNEFRTIEVNSELRTRHFEVEIDETVAKILQAKAKAESINISDLASTLLRRQLGLVA